MGISWTRKAILILVCLCWTSAAFGQDNANTARDQVITVRLTNYFYETISREEAIKRLEGRKLGKARFDEIARAIPPMTRHFLSLENGVFREFADFGEGPAHMLLMLPLEQRGPKRLLTGVAVGRNKEVPIVHELESTKDTLTVDGVPRTTFRFSTDPVTLQVDVSFVDPSAVTRHPHGSACCNSCEWVHSRLGIHNLDHLCCLGTCPQ